MLVAAVGPKLPFVSAVTPPLATLSPAAVPTTAAVWVIVEEASEIARAMPKSITLTAPESVMITLAGLMSRCTMPCWCE